MPGVLRFDTGSLGALERTPQGGIRVPATLTRTGLFRYQNPDGSVRVEYRPPDEVFHADSLATLRDAPVTSLHHGMIDATNWRKAAVGSISGDARQDGDAVVADLVIQDATTIRLIETGERREVSCGYRCQLDRTPGRTPKGEHYDAIQRKIEYNHVALVPRGRGGRDVALRLDSAENQIAPGEDTMKIEIIGGTEYEVGTAAHRKATGEREDTASKTSALKGEVTALTAEIKGLKERLDKAPGDLSASVRERVALIGHAAKVGAEIREDMTIEEVHRAVIGKTLPSIDLKGKDSAFIAAVFEVAITQPSSAISASQVREDARAAKTAKTREDADADADPPDVIARRKMINEGRKCAAVRHGLDKS